MSKKPRSAIEPTREQNFADWYQQVIKASELAENSPTRGCMTIKPWGYAIWERMQRLLDDQIKACDVENIYCPLLIPLSFFNKEAGHVDGFATECAVVTHHRLVKEGAELVPAGKLTEPLVVRPTSETLFGELFSRWIQSYRDLPCQLNQWANVMRWEMRPRAFLRSAEFLWQEGHTAHETESQAKDMASRMAALYQRFFTDVLAIPTVLGEKTAHERFAGGDVTHTLEALMQDGKALQAATSHCLGQNFARSFDVTYQDRSGQQQHVWNTSWGVTTRMIGALVMVHSDDDGCCLPPRIAPKQVVVIPIKHKQEHHAAVDGYVQQITQMLRCDAFGEPLRVHVDHRDMTGGEKKWSWIKKGVPLILEVGYREVNEGTVAVITRSNMAKQLWPVSELSERVVNGLASIQDHYLSEAKKKMLAQTERVTDPERWQQILVDKSRGFFLVPWSNVESHEKALHQHQFTIRALIDVQHPFYQEMALSEQRCIATGQRTALWALVSQAY